MVRDCLDGLRNDEVTYPPSIEEIAVWKAMKQNIWYLLKNTNLLVNDVNFVKWLYHAQIFWPTYHLSLIYSEATTTNGFKLLQFTQELLQHASFRKILEKLHPNFKTARSAPRFVIPQETLHNLMSLWRSDVFHLSTFCSWMTQLLVYGENNSWIKMYCRAKLFFRSFLCWKKTNYNKIERKRCWVGFGKEKKNRKKDFFRKTFLRKLFSQNVFWIDCGSGKHNKKILEVERGRKIRSKLRIREHHDSEANPSVRTLSSIGHKTTNQISNQLKTKQKNTEKN